MAAHAETENVGAQVHTAVLGAGVGSGVGLIVRQFPQLAGHKQAS